jgi:repressor LexA
VGVARRRSSVVALPQVGVARSGNDCFARIEPDHETTFKRVYFERDPIGREMIRLQPLNSAYPPRTLLREQVAGLYPAVSVMRSLA